LVLPRTTALGALLHYISDPERKKFQPMNANFGLLPPLAERLRGKAKKEMLSVRALADLDRWLDETALAGGRADGAKPVALSLIKAAAP
jgi:methylenetetrahydrofolate--tRNA-(uracil-5-)-methyltransferase